MSASVTTVRVACAPVGFAAGFVTPSSSTVTAAPAAIDLPEPSAHTAMLSEEPMPQLPRLVLLPETVTLLLTSVRTLASLGSVIVMCCPGDKAADVVKWIT